MSSVNKAFRLAILAGTGVTAAATGGVYYPRLPGGTGGWKPANGPAIVFSIRGGTPHAEIEDLQDPSFQVRVWAATTEEARTVYQLVRKALHGKNNLVTSEGKFLRIQEEGIGQDVIDPDTNWPTVLTAFSAMIFS